MDEQVHLGQPLTNPNDTQTSSAAKVQSNLAGSILALLLVLFISAVPMLVAVGQSDSKRTMENIAVLSAQETWLRQHGWQDIQPDPEAWLMPSRNGNPRIVKPPLVIWLDMLAWTGLTPADSTAQQLITRSRYVSVAMGLMVVAGVYWMGCVLWDRKMAVIAALSAGTMLFLTRQARIASYDMHMTGWATLAVASAIWAMRPFGPPQTVLKAVLGWGFAGVALAGAFMSKGPLAILVGAAPVLCTMLIIKSNWRRNVIGLIGMLIVAAVLTAPWYLYIMFEIRNAEGTLLHEYKAERMEFQTPFYYLGLLGLVLPWSMWLVAGLIQPFMRAEGEQRRRLMIAWAWFVLIFVAFSIPGAKQQRYILPIVPAVALLVGQLWRYHEQLAEQGEVDPGVNLLRVPHWVCLIAVSLLIWPFFTSQNWMLTHGWVKEMPIGTLSQWVLIPAALFLIALSIIGTIWHFQWKPLRAGIVTALWSAVLLTITWYAWATGERTIHPVRADAEKVGQIVDGGIFGILKHNKYNTAPNEEFLLYSRRIMPPVRPRELATFGQDYSSVYIAAPQQREAQRALRRNGYELVMPFQHDYDEVLDLWKRKDKPAEADTESSDNTPDMDE